MASDEVLKRIDAHIAHGNELMERNTAAFERHEAAFERHEAAFERHEAAFHRFEATLEREQKENRRFHREMMARLERWSMAAEARLIELGEEIRDQGDLIRAQTEALHRVLDRLPPAHG